MRLRLCDDHMVLVDALSMVPSDCGHTEVATAFDPEEAVEAARRHQPEGFPGAVDQSRAISGTFFNLVGMGQVIKAVCQEPRLVVPQKVAHRATDPAGQVAHPLCRPMTAIRAVLMPGSSW